MKESSTELGNITCRTRNSPPTYVTWERDGVRVPVNGDRYEMIQTVTDRQNSYYDSVLLIRDAVDLAGNHTYTCCVRNYAGSTCKTTSTHMTGELLHKIMIIIFVYNYIIYTNIHRVGVQLIS